MKHNIKKFAKFTFWLVLFLVLSFALYNARAEQIEYRDREVVVDNLGKKIEEIKLEALESLKQCESAGHSEDDGIVIFDANGKASYGQLQWQKSSVQHYYKTLYGKDITPKEAVLIALDTPKAQALAYDVIFTTEKGWTNWTNCAKKIGLVQTLGLVHKLEE